MQQTEYQLKQQNKLKRLTNKTFNFDPRIANGYYSANYFLKTTKIIQKYRPQQQILMQFFQKNEAILCGIDEVIALVHTFAYKPENLIIKALHDGDKISPYETVLTIEGNYASFGYLEGIIDGILARRSSVATNAYLMMQAAADKQVIFMGDRDDSYNQQQADGYASYIGGIHSQATDAMMEWIGGNGMGTMPHALIQQFDGDIIAACEAFHQTFPATPLVALIDYNNNVIEDSLLVAQHFQQDLFAVRVDTAANMVDQYFTRNNYTIDKSLYGTNPLLIKKLRETFDQAGFPWVKIIVSGGFTLDKVKKFNLEQVPVDFYGVGSSLIKVNLGFTGDCVLLNGKPQAKQGRKYNPNQRLELVEYPVITTNI